MTQQLECSTLLQRIEVQFPALTGCLTIALISNSRRSDPLLTSEATDYVCCAWKNSCLYMYMQEILIHMK